MKTLKSMVLVSATVACLGAGCSGSTSGDAHTLVSNVSEQVGAGSCVPVAGPYALPDGASTAYSISDIDDTDDMDIGVIDDGFGCDFASGYAVVQDGASVSSSDAGLVAGNYDLIVSCRNVFDACIFSVSWSANY